MPREYLSLAMVVGAVLGVSLVLRRIFARQRELRRFDGRRVRWWEFFVDDVKEFVRFRVSQRHTMRERNDTGEVQRLVHAGLDTTELRERYYLSKDVSVLGTTAVCALAFMWYKESVAVIVCVATIVIGFWGPRVWVAIRARERQSLYERELPFLLHAVAYGTEVGWDVVRVLHRLAQTYGDADAKIPLAKEIKRAQWYTLTGGKWSESFRQMQQRFPSSTGTYTVSALAEALDADAQNHELLSGIAREAHRNYLVRLEGKLAMLPVVTLTIGCVLLLGFSLLLQLPFL